MLLPREPGICHLSFLSSILACAQKRCPSFGCLKAFTIMAFFGVWWKLHTGDARILLRGDSDAPHDLQT